MSDKRVLMVEGPDDEHVVKHVCGRRQLGVIQSIHPYGGKDRLIESIAARLKESDITVLRFLVPQGDDLLAHADQAIDGIPPALRRFSDVKEAKARIHTWLAWQEEPGKPFGQAISALYLDPNLPAADVFAAWIKRTFFS